jgi:uncharacterized protein YqeY
MSLQTKIVEEWKTALKNKDIKKDALSMIITEFKNRAIKDNVQGDDGRMVSDDIAIEVLQKMAKLRREAIDAYQVANRPDLVEKEQRELAVVESYLPAALSDDELQQIVEKAIKDLNATSMKNMGAVMSESIKAASGRADGKRIQAMVQAKLGGR